MGIRGSGWNFQTEPGGVVPQTARPRSPEAGAEATLRTETALRARNWCGASKCQVWGGTLQRLSVPYHCRQEPEHPERTFISVQSSLEKFAEKEVFQRSLVWEVYAEFEIERTFLLNLHVPCNQICIRTVPRRSGFNLVIASTLRSYSTKWCSMAVRFVYAVVSLQ